ncbi:MAG TPA: hypothetical protein DCG12_00145, partial [Planctomycetaceae bacterium]|nr:hypothetical protein [Planctomycetaceae bacterium]
MAGPLSARANPVVELDLRFSSRSAECPERQALTMIRRFIDNYLPRHTHPLNRGLHAIGVPLSFIVAPAAAIAGADWYWHVGSFIGGYVLQFAGHAIEGNDAGEVVFVKKILG